MEQETLNLILQALGWIGLIILCPFFWRFFYAFAKFITYKLFPIKTLYIQYKHDEVVIKQIKIKLDSKDPIIQQLKTIKSGEVNFDKK